MCDGGTFQYSGGRDAYVARHTFSQQLRYTDPTDAHLHLLPMPINHLLLDSDTVTIAQVQFSYTIDLSDWKRIYLVCTPNDMGVLVAKSLVLCVITAGSNNNSMEGRANSRGTHGGTQCHPCSPWSQRSNHMHEVIRLVFFICFVTFPCFQKWLTMGIPLSVLSIWKKNISYNQEHLSVFRTSFQKYKVFVWLPIKQHPTDIWFMQTCRLVPVAAVGAMRNFLGGASNFLITSSCDHTIRIWGKVASFHSMQSPVLCSHDMFSLDLHFAVSKRQHDPLFKTMYYSLSWKTHNGQKQEFQEYAQSPG